ncbi:MAG TPA: hypothetical protein VD862_02475 [Candidatus Paceibacterota bacterium]|nr:hypothetical protein [Candidatus Paceibacterota bacterium]
MKIAAIFILVAVSIGAFLLFSRTPGQNDAVPEPTAADGAGTTGTPAPEPAQEPARFTVRITANGMSPGELSVSSGDTVVFVNETDSRRWPASDPHPVHTLCPGFDSGGIPPGQEYVIPFTEVRTCTYHDHLSPGDERFRGVIHIR